jgi:cobalamin biosynthesis Mg chelatase CobN
MIVGTRHHRALHLGRPLFALMSVIALALACFPVLAHAEDASGVQYSDAIPKAEGENSPVQHKRPPVAKAADNGGAAAPTGMTDSDTSNEPGDGSSESDSSSREGGAAPKGSDSGTGQGKPAGSANHASGPKVQHSGQIAATPSSQSSGSSSSPLVPILIAILVLAAISVAVVMIRQRRQGGSATPASPKAS